VNVTLCDRCDARTEHPTGRDVWTPINIDLTEERAIPVRVEVDLSPVAPAGNAISAIDLCTRCFIEVVMAALRGETHVALPAKEGPPPATRRRL
jgi:hypothetical protein